MLRAASLALLVGVVACSSRAPEPERHVERAPPPTATASLRWDAPASWSLEKSAEKGRYRAKYVVPAQGNAEHPAEVLVSSLGKGDAAALDESFRELLSDFEGPGVADPIRREREVHGFTLRELEVAGTYKYPMGPRIKKRAAAQVIKEGFRAIAVGVKAPDGELWFFRLVGPDDAVQAARSPFAAMMDSLGAVPGAASDRH